jgi:hypothetical protein
MTYAQLMNVVNTCHQFLEMLASRLLLEPLVLNNKLEEFASTRKLHYQVKVLLGLNNFIDLNYIWVMKLFQNLYFATDPLHILFVLYFRFFKHFHCNFFPCQNMSAKANLAKRTLTKSLAQNVVAHRGASLCCSWIGRADW